jgi:hypothetical protein
MLAEDVSKEFGTFLNMILRVSLREEEFKLFGFSIPK